MVVDRFEHLGRMWCCLDQRVRIVFLPGFACVLVLHSGLEARLYRLERFAISANGAISSALQDVQAYRLPADARAVCQAPPLFVTWDGLDTLLALLSDDAPVAALFQWIHLVLCPLLILT